MRSIRTESLTLFKRNLCQEDRILISGASGWFGQTAIIMTRAAGVKYMATGSSSRILRVGGFNEKVETHNLETIAAFEPTIVIDAAFLTREKIQVIGIDKFIAINQLLIEISKKIASLSSVKKYVGFSSGATVNLAGLNSFSLSDNPYAFLKKTYEEQMVELNNLSDATVTIPRVFSVTGAHVNKPELFAFSNLILQSRLGVIKVQSKNRVLRRYSPVEDIIALALAQSKQHERIVFDTGGEMVEVGDLADKIRMEIRPDADIIRNINPDLMSDDYKSDNVAWCQMLDKNFLKQDSLSEQIKRVAANIA